MSKSADAFRTISEVADWLDTPAHVLRFWESKFAQVKPVKRAGGRRYYRPADMALLGGIKTLLREDGLTIKGVQKVLREKGVKHVAALSPPITDSDEPGFVTDVDTSTVVDLGVHMARNQGNPDTGTDAGMADAMGDAEPPAQPYTIQPVAEDSVPAAVADEDVATDVGPATEKAADPAPIPSYMRAAMDDAAPPDDSPAPPARENPEPADEPEAPRASNSDATPPSFMMQPSPEPADAQGEPTQEPIEEPSLPPPAPDLPAFLGGTASPGVTEPEGQNPPKKADPPQDEPFGLFGSLPRLSDPKTSRAGRSGPKAETQQPALDLGLPDLPESTTEVIEERDDIDDSALLAQPPVPLGSALPQDDPLPENFAVSKAMLPNAIRGLTMTAEKRRAMAPALSALAALSERLSRRE